MIEITGNILCYNISSHPSALWARNAAHVLIILGLKYSTLNESGWDSNLWSLVSLASDIMLRNQFNQKLKPIIESPC